MDNNESGKLNPALLESIFRTSKKTVQEYSWEIERYCRFKSIQHLAADGMALDDRSKLIDLYEACVQQDAHLASVLETLKSQIVGERYMLATMNEKGKFEKDVEATKKIQGTQFVKIIIGIVEAKLYGYTLLEILPETDKHTGRLKSVKSIERRNVLPDQNRVVLRQGSWTPGWDITSPQYEDNYILINTDTVGLFSSTTPLILAKKFTMANYVNFSHTYGQPIIHGKTGSDRSSDKKRLADDISNAATQKVLVTGMDDSVDIKTFTMSNSEKIYTGLIEFANKEVSNLILGSYSMAGGMQSYAGSTKAHQDIFRDRVEVYREYIENVMNEQVIPRLIKMGYLQKGLFFKYSNKKEMSTKDKIDLYTFITSKYEVSPEEIEKEFGINVGKQFLAEMSGNGGVSRPEMSPEEYFKRYGKAKESRNLTDKDKGTTDIKNFLTEMQ